MTITRKELPDGRVEITMTEQDKAYLQAYAYQEMNGLSTTRSAVQARIKYWQRQRDRIAQEEQAGVDVTEWVELP